jgi:hypothetical protein
MSLAGLCERPGPSDLSITPAKTPSKLENSRGQFRRLLARRSVRRLDDMRRRPTAIHLLSRAGPFKLTGEELNQVQLS